MSDRLEISDTITEEDLAFIGSVFDEPDAGGYSSTADSARARMIRRMNQRQAAENEKQDERKKVNPLNLPRG